MRRWTDTQTVEIEYEGQSESELLALAERLMCDAAIDGLPGVYESEIQDVKLIEAYPEGFWKDGGWKWWLIYEATVNVTCCRNFDEYNGVSNGDFL